MLTAVALLACLAQGGRSQATVSTKGADRPAGKSGKTKVGKASKTAAKKRVPPAVVEGRTGKPQVSKSSNWLFQAPSNVVPNQQGKVVLFTFRNDDGDAVSTQVGRLLEARGLEVMTGVRPVDNAEQFRDVATHLGLAAFVDGDVRGSEARTQVTVRVRSGFTGRHISKVVFAESRDNLPREMSDTLWKKVGAVVARACVDAGKPRRPSRTTLQINAGTPIETVPNETR